MLTVTVNSARNKQGMGINRKTHTPLGPQQTREWKNKRSTAWKRQDVRLRGEDSPPGNQFKLNQFVKTTRKRPTTLVSNSKSAKRKNMRM